jgi:uncharacterized protein (DUF924 family)
MPWKKGESECERPAPPPAAVRRSDFLMTTPEWVDQVLGFWFGELTEKDWFGGSEELDARVRERFEELHASLAGDETIRTPQSGREALAAIILFDQMPRNMFRRTPEAFASDAVALSIARHAVDHQLDAGMSAQERQFLYMPFMHSEVVADQERCVDLFRTLDNEEGLKYAIEHRDIVARFGRFPHRNKALGRQSTAEEISFLEGHAGYGQ